MTNDPVDAVEFDELIALALARAADAGESPRPDVRQRVLSRIGETVAPVPPGFSFRLADDEDWQPHPVPGINF